jgi:hypothetical protein
MLKFCFFLEFLIIRFKNSLIILQKFSKISLNLLIIVIYYYIIMILPIYKKIPIDLLVSYNILFLFF